MIVRRMSAGLVALALIAGACGNDGGKFSEAFRSSFMQSCSASESEAFCSCYLDELQQRYTQDEIFRVVIEGSETPPQEFIDAGLACAIELDG